MSRRSTQILHHAVCFVACVLQLSSLVVGTEAKQLLLLDAGCSAIELAVNLPSVPTHLATHGTLAVEYRINVACRDGTVYAVKDRQLMATKIEVGSLPCGIVRTEGLLYVGAMDGTLAGFHPKGKRQWATTMPAPITAMSRATIRKAEVADCCVVALEGGQVRLYNGRSCVSTIMASDTITGAPHCLVSPIAQYSARRSNEQCRYVVAPPHGYLQPCSLPLLSSRLLPSPLSVACSHPLRAILARGKRPGADLPSGCAIHQDDAPHRIVQSQ